MHRLAVAEKLDRKVDQWIWTAREEIFAPIGRDVVELWAVLNPDADLKLTGIALAGGTKIRRTVALDLADGDMVLPDRKNSAAVLSTGQRNALSLATYLPRATQPASPFGFLILDDPIHAFDTWRVRYLARHLVTLSKRFQVVVFTHDDRLWRETPGAGRGPDALSAGPARRWAPSGAGQERREPGNPAAGRAPEGPRQRKGVPARHARSGGGHGPDRVPTSDRHRGGRPDRDAGRRAGLPEATVVADLRRARKTRDQLSLLNDYARRAGLRPIALRSFESTVDALNGASHGRSAGGEPPTWVRQTRKLVIAVQEIGH